MPDEILNEVPQDEAQADKLIESIDDSGRGPIDDAATIIEKPAAEEYVIKVDGKEVKGTREQLLTWATQGYGAPNKIGELSKQLKEYQTKEGQFKDWEKTYGPVDQYVRKNPQWWNHVNEQFQALQKQQQADPNNPVISKLVEEVGSLKELASTVMTERQQLQQKQEDAQYMSEFEAIKKQYPKVDFHTADETGKSLEYKILEYAQSKKIGEFKTAFRDYYHDDLLKIHEEQAKEKTAKDRFTKTKTGIIGESRTPTTKSTNDSVRGKSYNQLEREALQELGLA